MPSVFQDLPDCFVGVPTITTDALVVNVEDIVDSSRGLKSGGRYQWAVLVQGDCGRISAAYPINFIDIPKTQDKGYLGFCNFSYEDQGMNLPTWAKCLKILRTSNLNNYELQWRVDKITKTDDGKIKLTIQTLNDYNQQYGFKTNTTYQWVKGDRIEFIFNGDGSVLNTDTFGSLNYLALNPFFDENEGTITDPPADFFNQLIIQDDGRLEEITEGAIIEMQRPVAATDAPIYYSICSSIPVVNGRLLNPYGTFNTFDTFLVNRVINSSQGSFVGTYEHHSPSDFWGERISDAGKRYVENEFENEKRYGRSIAINSPTVFNYFDSRLVKKFDAPGQGDITAMTIYDGKIILAICENDNFMAQSADELVRVGGDGVIRALPPDAIISDAEPKPSGAFGCQYDDIGSVFFGDGYAKWVDSNKKADILHDLNSARNVAEGKASSFFHIKCQRKVKHNLAQAEVLNKYRWATGINSQTGEIFLTLKTLRLGSINNSSKWRDSEMNTIIYHPPIGEYLGFASFIPEAYSQIELSDGRGVSFVSFSKGIPFIHPVIPDKFNEFFGISCDEMVGVTVNKTTQKQKKPLALEIMSGMKWFSPEITTDKLNFISEIPPVRIKRNNNKWNGGFLYNKNSRGGLYGDSKNRVAEDVRGKFINILLVRDNTEADVYNSVNNEKRTSYDEFDGVLIKYVYIEQSGFQNNL